MKLIVKSLKPRNPLATAARHRHAGAHCRSSGGQRLRAQRELQRELQLERRPCP